MVGYIVPEIVIGAFASLIILLNYTVANKKILGYLSLLAVVLAFFSLFKLPKMVAWGIYAVDDFSIVFKAVFLTVAFLVILSSLRSINKREGEYYSLLLMSLMGMLLLASSIDLLMLYVALELATVPSFILAGFFKNRQTSEAAMKYFVFAVVSSGLIVFGMSLLYGITGTTNIYEMINRLELNAVSILASLFLVAGFAFKMAAFPFHAWAPDVYQGSPTPISAFLSSASKKMGFLAVLRIFYVALSPVANYWALAFAILAALTMTYGNIVALTQKNVKRMLAYSSIGHAGYIIIALALLNTKVAVFAIAAALLHIFVHAVMKAGAFIAGIVAGENLDDYKGLGKRAPITALMLTILLLSLIGVPPLAGFLSKFYILLSAIYSGSGIGYILAVLLIVNSAISIFYYGRIISYMYWAKSDDEVKVNEPFSVTVALIIAAVLVIVIGLYPSEVVSYLQKAAESFVKGL